ncbi:MAG: hypothetical protein R3C28_27150 [Pirellulaceae bacterium]
MKRKTSWLAIGLMVAFGTARLNAGQIMYLLGNELAPTEGNEAIIEFFEARGDTLDFWDNNLLQNSDPDDALDAANLADLVFIDESISSSRADIIIDTDTPVIINEQYAFDNWGLTDFAVGHGSPGRPNAAGDLLVAGSAFGTTINIVNAAHPIASGAGLGAGEVQIYDDTGGRIDWGRPGGDADIVAEIPGAPGAAAIFVYEPGDALVFGGTAAGMRIGFFLSDTNRGPEPDDPEIADDSVDNSWDGREATLLTAEGIALLNSAVDYALGLVVSVPGDFNGDGMLDIADINQLSMASASNANDASFDLTDDALVNANDLTFWIKDLKNSWIGDANLDGEFNSGDFVQVFTAGKFEQQVEANWADGDWNGDGRFNSGDFVAAFTDGGFELGPRAGVHAVPEPASGVGVAMLWGLLAIRRNRR